MRSSPSSPNPTPHLDALLETAREATSHFRAWRRSRLGLRGMLLYLLAGPLAPAAIVALASGNFSAAMAAAFAFALIVIGGILNRRGIMEELIAPQRRFTRRLGLPHKYPAAVAVASGTALAAYGAVGQNGLVSIAFGLLALAGFHMAYRLPPLRRIMGVPRQVVRDRNLRDALVQAEERILSIEKAAARLGNRELEQRLRRIAHQGRAVLEQIVTRPDERFRARKFLNVYLEGAERVASHYARTHRLARGGELEQNFRIVLEEIERVFGRQLEQLSEHDVFDLDVQIEVLRKQLEREGIT
jgi:hypothetical protein